MPDILHRVGIKSSSPQETYAALTTIEGLSGWWTDETKAEAGDTIRFTFGDKGFFVMKVLENAPASRVRWRVVDGPAEWIGTHVSFDLVQEGGFTTVLFKHEGWKEAVEFMHHCSTKWAVFLMSLKSMLETGKGAAHPHDVKIDNWN